MILIVILYNCPRKYGIRLMAEVAESFNPKTLMGNLFSVFFAQKKDDGIVILNLFLEGSYARVSFFFNRFHEFFHVVPIDVLLCVIEWARRGFERELDSGIV